MGQYWLPVNLDKKEFIEPHKLGSGLKLWEQLAQHPGTGAALIVLCAAMPDRRGGGDLEENDIVGRWTGDRIAIVGDYAEDDDLPNPQEGDIPANQIYENCHGDEPTFTDITDAVAEVIEKELQGEYTGSGWRDFTYDKR